METLLLLHFKRDPNGLLALSAGWESLFLRDELQREGTVFQLFLPELPNGYELLEEIGTYHPSRLILCADGENQAVVTGFLSFLNKAAPGLEAKIVHVGPPAPWNSTARWGCPSPYAWAQTAFPAPFRSQRKMFRLSCAF